MGGEGMQMVFGIAYATSNPNIVYMVSDTSQVWKSTDGGTTWQMKHKGFQANGGISIAVDPVNENVVFVAGSNAETYYVVSPADGIYRTLDGGENWSLVKQTPYFRGKEGTHFAFDKSSPKDNRTTLIYAGTHTEGLLKSVDGGTTWKCLGLKGMRIFDVKINPKDNSRIMVATQAGLYIFGKDEDTMVMLPAKGLPVSDLPVTSFAFDEADPNIIYVAARKSGVYRSEDSGSTFHPINNGLVSNLDYNQISACNSKHLYVSVEKNGGLNPFFSINAGKSWNMPDSLDSELMSIIKGRYFSAPVAVHPGNCLVALTSANGADRIIKTTDGGKTWSYSSSGYTGGRIGVGKSSLAFYKNQQKMVFFLIDFGPSLTVDGGKTFTLLDIPRLGAKTTPVGAVSPGADENLIVTAIGEWKKQTLALSRDDGNNWNVIPGTEDNYKCISFHPQKPNIIYAQGFVSKDAGISWKQLSHKVYAVFKGNGDIVYSIDDSGENKSVVVRSNDQGETWATPYTILPFEAKNINEIDVDTINPNRIYVAANSGFYIYQGNTWEVKGEKSGLGKDYFGGMYVKCVAVDPKHPEVVYAGRWAPGKGHSNGIFRSINHGNTWENITFNLIQPITIWSTTISPHAGTVYIGSSHGTWKLPPPY
ncbi:MAG: hypothetical protein HW406_10 [Candidatus Brocadiaceae bacterium]|nr:hypothetical protein [Candidatus Brocadiaceae bacterium]